MRARIVSVVAAVIALVPLSTTPALAIVGGQPDGNDHPYEALLLVPGEGYCSGTLVSPTVILTAGHCTEEFTALGADQIAVSFDPEPAVDANGMPIDPNDWSTASTWATHPAYNADDWPLTIDAGVVILDQPVDITPAELPDAGVLDGIIPNVGTTRQTFQDVGYGISDYVRGLPTNDIVRKQSVQTYAPGKGGGVLQGFTDTLLMLRNQPSSRHGGACPGDSGSGVFLDSSDTVVGIHMGGYRLGHGGVLCGRITSSNLRVDTPVVLDWLSIYL